MINLSKAAAREVLRLKSKYPQPHALFRLGVQASGCCDLSYTMTFDEVLHPEDRVYESEGVQVVIESRHLNYIDGLTVDYSEDLMGGGFRFHNPHATQNCSCGNSFSVSS